MAKRHGNGTAKRGAKERVGNPPRFSAWRTDQRIHLFARVSLLRYCRDIGPSAITARISRNAARLLLKLELHWFIGCDHLGFISRISQCILRCIISARLKNARVANSRDSVVEAFREVIFSSE